MLAGYWIVGRYINLSYALEEPLISKKYKLEKFPGKGGWTYILIPEIPKDPNAHFGMVKVKGFIDDFELKSYNLMPIKRGGMFLPVKAEIRKKIEKKEGDWVQLTLFPDKLPLEIPEDLLLCLLDEPIAHQAFLNFTEGVRREFINWIYSAKKEETKIERIAKTINMVLKGQKITGNK